MKTQCLILSLVLVSSVAMARDRIGKDSGNWDRLVGVIKDRSASQSGTFDGVRSDAQAVFQKGEVDRQTGKQAARSRGEGVRDGTLGYGGTGGAANTRAALHPGAEQRPPGEALDGQTVTTQPFQETGTGAGVGENPGGGPVRVR